MIVATEERGLGGPPHEPIACGPPRLTLLPGGAEAAERSRVEALRRAVRDGTYRPRPVDIAEAMIARDWSDLG